MAKRCTLKIGQEVAVVCQKAGSPKKGDTELCFGVVDAITAAEDRPYRISVRGHKSGVYWRDCAPECVMEVIA